MKTIIASVCLLLAYFGMLFGGQCSEISGFTVTNYPGMLAAWNAYDEFCSTTTVKKTDGYGLARRFWDSQDDSTKANYVASILAAAADNFTEYPIPVHPNFGFTMEQCGAIDDALCAIGARKMILAFWWWGYNANFPFPKCTENWISGISSDKTNKFAAAISVFRASLETGGKLSLPQKLNVYVEQAAKGMLYSRIKEPMLNDAQRLVRHALRDSGKSIVVDKDTGINPVKVALDGLVLALDAPKCEGVKEWVAEWCPDYDWVDIRCWKTDEEIQKLREKVWYGDIKCEGFAKNILLVYLGLEEYNKFVEQYNK